MSILLIMIPLSILLVVAGAIAFFWAVNHDQFEDMDSPALLPSEDAVESSDEAQPPTDREETYHRQ